MWDLCIRSWPRARKTYYCNAAEFILNSGCNEEDFKAYDWEVIQHAEEEGFMILPGEKYVKVRGKWDGEWVTFRARPELDRICHDYDLYED
jgi:hypothetical protein